MDDRTQGAMLLAVGGVALRLGLTTGALTYVRPGLRPPLAVAGATLCLLGAVAVFRTIRSEHQRAADEPEPAAGGAPGPAPAGTAAAPPRGHRQAPHGHHHTGAGPAVGWLLLLPLLALLLVAPPPLGAFAAARQSGAVPVDTTAVHPALPDPREGAVELPVSEFVARALYDERGSLEGVRVRLTGFVSDLDVAGGYQVSRFVVGCCAADGRAVDVVAADPAPAPGLDSWVELEGVLRPGPAVVPGAAAAPPVLQVSARRLVDPPEQPYEY
jgi:uncharacterized repeat protein (TIGR03943 family)